MSKPELQGFTIVHTIGKGASSEVFEAFYDTDKSQRFAIKCFPKASEILIHKQLHHNNIIAVHDIIKRAGRAYLVLELCKGGPLSKYLQKRNTYYQQQSSNGRQQYDKNDGYIKPRVPYNIIRRVVKQLCKALQYLHELKIVHRDINLNNVLLVDPVDHGDFHIKVCDFGLAIDLSLVKSKIPARKIPVQLSYDKLPIYQNNCLKTRQNHLDDSNKSLIQMSDGQTLCGTPGFIAPEIINGQQCATPANDAYSVGAIIYTLVKGEKPSKGRISVSKMPPLLKDLIVSLLEENPNLRLTINDILRHPFILGPISCSRLPPILRRTKTLELSIDDDGRAIVRGLTNQSCIESDRNGKIVTITTKSGQCLSYKFDELSKTHWSKYHCLSSFVDLVKSKIAKVNFYCNKTIGRGVVIEKCCIMEDESFEVTISNPANFSSPQSPHLLVFDRDESQFQNSLLSSAIIKSICSECKKLEIELNRSSSDIIFPASFGQKPNQSASLCSNGSLRMRDLRLNTSGDSCYLNQSCSMSSIDETAVKAYYLTGGKLTVVFNDQSRIDHNPHESALIYYKPDGSWHVCSLDAINSSINEIPGDLPLKLPKVHELMSKIYKTMPPFKN